MVLGTGDRARKRIDYGQNLLLCTALEALHDMGAVSARPLLSPPPSLR
jgi:hypothetical protein